MAKKGQQAQLQVELSTDEEWEKFLQRPGLLVIDIYSEWSGPCAGMQANLKKLKLELGGDSLQLAIAKCDTIDALERFRGTSEPTWMFVSGGKMVNFMYGANAPKLTKVITDELKIQQMVDEGTYNRSKVLDISERAPDEAERYEAAQAVIKAEEAIEKAKKDQECRERLLKESDAILENLGTLGVMLVFPQARDKYMDVLKEPMQEAGLVISISEKVKITEEQIQNMLYFANGSLKVAQLPEKSVDTLFNAESQMVVVKASHGTTDIEDPVSVRILTMLYGPSQGPPGESDCIFQRLIHHQSEEELVFEAMEAARSSQEAKSKSATRQTSGLDNKSGTAVKDQKSANLKVYKSSELMLGNEGENNEESEENLLEEGYQNENFIIGIWAPPTRRILSTCFKVFFHRMAQPLLIPEPEPTPPYFSIVFPISKREKVVDLMEEWESEIMNYGIFTGHNPETATLVAKTWKKYDKLEDKTNYEEVIIQLSKKKSECVFAFAIEIPEYMSPNAFEGKEECKIFFPEGYKKGDEDSHSKSSEEREEDEVNDVTKEKEYVPEDLPVDDTDVIGSDHVSLETQPT